MNKALPFFNWSLKKALETVPDNFTKARIRIIYTILIFAFLKILVAIATAISNEQWLQTTRGSIAIIFYLSLFKLLLYKPSTLKALSHIMLSLGVLLVWSNVFIYIHGINLPTLQFAFMVMLSGFYTLGTRWGITYSVLSIVPVTLSFLVNKDPGFFLTSETEVLASPGFEIVIILNFVSIIIAHYLFYSAFQVNLDEKERLNKQLQQSIAEATSLATSRANFLSTMSHELRTPLNSVIGITEILIADKPEEHQKENLKILQFSSHDLLALINNILDFNKLDSDKLTLESVTFNLSEFMQNICAVLRIKATGKKLDFALEIDKRLEKVNVISDPTRLSQVLYNLVGNAIKFTDRGSITVQLQCIHLNEHETDVRFSITDTGIGISPDKHETIFELFSQAESSISRKYGGTGLGLAIVKQVLTLFKSDIQMNSVPGQGTTFSFTIPFTTTIASADTSFANSDNQADLSDLRILIAEDNELNRLIMKKQLDKLNITPVVVENGKAAVERLLSQDFDVIFMDLHMPMMDGYHATREIRSLADPTKANIYIVAFTASVTEQQDIMTSGFSDYLYKPVNMHDLRDKLEKVKQLSGGKLPK